MSSSRRIQTIRIAEPAARPNYSGQDIMNPQITRQTSMKAFCVCGRYMVKTTPKDVRNGVQPHCPLCKPKE